MPEQFSNQTEQSPQLTPEQLEQARRIIEQEQQKAAGEFADAHEAAAGARDSARVQAEQARLEEALSAPPDIPGITRPDASEVAPTPESQDPLASLNSSLARGEKAKAQTEAQLNQVLAGKIEGGGPEAWTNAIGELQEDDLLE